MNRIAEARKEADLTRKEMSELYGIPVRTIENWETGKRKCPEYLENFIVERLQDETPEGKWFILGSNLYNHITPQLKKRIDGDLNNLTTVTTEKLHDDISCAILDADHNGGMRGHSDIFMQYLLIDDENRRKTIDKILLGYIEAKNTKDRDSF